MIYYFTRPYNYDDGVSVSSAGGNDVVGQLPAEAVDNDKLSYWENDGATPDLIIDLGVAQDIDSLWFKHDNISTFDLSYSDDGAAWTPEAETNRIAKGASVFWQFEFTLRTKRYWKISVTAKIGGGNIKIYEVMLMEQRLALDEDEHPKRPGVSFADRIGGGYTMADGSKTTYAGQREYAEIGMEWEYLDPTPHDSLLALYNSPILRSPVTILPREEYPAEIFRCVWESTGFNFEYTIPFTDAGFSGKLEWSEY